MLVSKGSTLIHSVMDEGVEMHGLIDGLAEFLLLTSDLDHGRPFIAEYMRWKGVYAEERQ